MKKSTKSTTTNKSSSARNQRRASGKGKPVTIDLKAEKVAGKDTPGVGLDLVVHAEVRVFAPVGEEVGDVGLGGAEGGGGIGVEGDVKMNSSGARSGDW